MMKSVLRRSAKKRKQRRVRT